MSTPSGDRRFFLVNGLLSLLALAFLAWLLLLRQGGGEAAELSFLPAVNAGLNSTSAILLTVGWWAIKNKKVRLHRGLMLSAFVFSALFLVCYVIYHYAHGDTRYQGEGPLRTLYFFVLITHVLLSMGLVPLVLTTFYFALRDKIARHKKIARFTLPIWLYVSVTGMLIFVMLKMANG